MSEHLLPQHLSELTVRRVLVAGWQLFHQAQRPLAAVAAVFVGLQSVLALLLRYGLYGTVVEFSDFSPQGLVRQLLPWQDVRVGMQQPYSGPLGQWAGLFGILAGLLAFVGTFALLRAASLSFHRHGASLTECVRTGVQRLPSALATLARQVYVVVLWPLVVLLVLLVANAGLRAVRLGGALGRALEFAPAVLWWVGGTVIAMLVLLRGLRVMLAWAALIDQGLGSSAALRESERLAEGLRGFLLRAGVTLLLGTWLIAALFFVMLGSGVGLLGLPADASTYLLVVLLAASDVLLLPLGACWYYALYRSVLHVRGGAARS